MTEKNIIGKVEGGFSFKKELSNMVDATKNANLPNVFGVSYNSTQNDNLSTNINYNKLYLKSLIQPLKNLFGLRKMEKYLVGVKN